MSSRRLLLAILFVAALLVMLWVSVQSSSREPTYRSLTQEIMAAPVTVVAPELVAAEAAAIVFDIFRDIDVTMSEWKPGSPLAAVNEAAGSHSVKVPADLLGVILRGIEIGDLTDGAFDITWASLWGVWDFKAEQPQLPDSVEIKKRVDLIDYRDVVIDEKAATVQLNRTGMLIGLGGIAKGTALDRSAEALKRRGIDSFLLSAGGHVVVHGKRGDRPWRLGLRDPRGATDDHFAQIELSDTSASTSGDYERFFMLDGVRYHHILDPRTGMPARGLRSATVICADAELADALSTAMMILGPEAALALAERREDVEAVLVDDEGRILVSSGLEGRIRIRHSPAG